MPRPDGRHILLALSAATCVAAVAACSSPQHASTSPGTTPAVWTGSAAPSAAVGPEAAQPAAQGLMARLRGPDGVEVAAAKFDFGNGYATITIATSGPGRLGPGLHGVHIHKVGKCEANSVGPTGGAPGDFLSAGDHFQASGHTGEPASGDLSSLQVRKDGTGELVTSTDAFAMEDLLTGEKTAIIIHAGADNAAPTPDGMTMTTGDPGKRVACGVIGAG
ncbi:superoxide dismutase [Cu-Zn] [Mycobacterium saskatchewanense]|uniref:Superoxide dismutase [Cu-Zn] n=1 Tax=Mycobacterium saskatchewanense TaxID=220927 RepID=A0AAJ3NK23_9MYCO|nr:superoxide dismutase family protein [Mycobacterium saskatchewanense]ORW63974.1 superoxide dismutase [Mycobacterium saskatchewanense]BBX64974.1 superoxide dismutase [Cu-Zn] [Mycobacterium saskatchewanense]